MMETVRLALASRRSKVEVQQCCFDGYGLKQVGLKGSAPESSPTGLVEESRTDAEVSKMNNEEEEEDEYSEYSDEYSSEGSDEEHVDVPSTGANKGVLNDEDEYSDESGSEGLEGEQSEEHSHEQSEGEYFGISADDEASAAKKEAEHNDMIASGAEADEASGANEEAEKEELLDMSKVSAPDGGDFMCPAPPCDSQESQAEVDQDSGLVLFQYFCAVRVPGFRAGLRLGAERLPSPPSLRCGACVERWRQQRRPQRRG